MRKLLSSAFILLYPDVLFSAKIHGIRKYFSLSSYPFLMLCSFWCPIFRSINAVLFSTRTQIYSRYVLVFHQQNHPHTVHSYRQMEMNEMEMNEMEFIREMRPARWKKNIIYIHDAYHAETSRSSLISAIPFVLPLIFFAPFIVMRKIQYSLG